MSTLYVDIDDTLVTWKDPLEGRLAHEWEVNVNVVQMIQWWNENAIGPVVIWSSGGQSYARMWADRLLCGSHWSACESKFNLLPQPGDVCLDDMPFDSFARQTIHPKELAGIKP